MSKVRSDYWGISIFLNIFRRLWKTVAGSGGSSASTLRLFVLFERFVANSGEARYQFYIENVESISFFFQRDA